MTIFNIINSILVVIIIILVFIYFLIFNHDHFYIYLKQNGFVVQPNFLSDDELQDLSNAIRHQIITKQVESKNVIEKKNRHHYALIIDKTIKKIIHKIYISHYLTWDTLTPEPEVVECALFISEPNCNEQFWHRDIDVSMDNKTNIFSIGIALNDIDKDMAPLQLFPKSHTHQLSALTLNRMFPYTSLDCKKGTLYVWDNRIMHRGGSNTSNKKRYVFYVSFMSKQCKKPYGPTYALHSKYKNLDSTTI